MPDNEKLIKVINAVKSHPILFKNLEKNENDLKEWSAVAQECKIAIPLVQELWNILLEQYIGYLKYDEDFSLAHHMVFLQPYFFKIIDSDNIDEEELLKVIDPTRLEETDTICLDIKEFTNSTTTDLVKNIKVKETSKTDKPPGVSDNIEFKTFYPVTNVTQDSSFTNLSPLELIFLGYAKQLQKMPLPLQLKVKRKISDVMDEAELQTMC